MLAPQCLATSSTMPTYIPHQVQYCGIVHTLPSPWGHFQPVVVYLPLEQLDVHAEIVDGASPFDFDRV